MESVVIQQPNNLVIEQRNYPNREKETFAFGLNSPEYADRTVIFIAVIIRLRNIHALSVTKFLV